MSDTVQDRIKYRTGDYLLAGANGSGLFRPADHGLDLASPTPTNPHGYRIQYQVDLGRLLVESLWVQPRDPGSLPPLVYGAPYDPLSSSFASCPDPVPFTGRLLLVRDFQPESDLGQELPPAWKLKEVHELTFEDSWLVKENDRSALMAGYFSAESSPGQTPQKQLDDLANLLASFDLGFLNQD